MLEIGLWKEKKVKSSLKRKETKKRLAEILENWTLIEQFINSDSVPPQDAISIIKWLESWKEATVDLLKVEYKKWFPCFKVVKRFENATLNQINWSLKLEAEKYKYDEIIIYFETHN